MFDSLIFDMDGTLWNSSETVADSWNSVISQCAYVKEKVTSETFHKVMGMQLPQIGKLLFPYLSEEKRDALMHRCCTYECEVLAEKGGVLYPGLEATLEELAKRYRLFIVSNCQKGYIEAFYKFHGLGKYFQGYESAGNTGLSKAQNIGLVVQRSGLKNAAYIGDTQIDYESSRKACVPFIYASYGFGKPESYDCKLNCFSDLARFF